MFRHPVRWLIAFLMVLGLTVPALAADPWKKLGDGLWLAEFPTRTSSPDEVLAVLRIDPRFHSFHLLLSSELGVPPRTLAQWVKDYRMAGAINASMFWEDRRTSTGYLRNGDHLNNASFNARFGAFFIFDPIDPYLPPVQIVEKTTPGWQNIISRYRGVVQNYRMISTAGEGLWPQSGKLASLAAVAVDRKGMVLFIHGRTARSVYDYNRLLLSLPLDIYCAMYVDGGPVAGMYVRAGNYIGRWAGGYESSFWESANAELWPIPNALAFKSKGE